MRQCFFLSAIVNDVYSYLHQEEINNCKNSIVQIKTVLYCTCMLLLLFNFPPYLPRPCMLFPSDPKEVSIYRVNNGDDHGIRDCGCLPIASNCGCAAASPKIFCRASHSGAEYGMHPLSSLWYLDVYSTF